jgi:hypothetical protein
MRHLEQKQIIFSYQKTQNYSGASSPSGLTVDIGATTLHFITWTKSIC